MNPPDFNWADFGGITLLQVARDHRQRLPADLAQAVDASILHAAESIKKRNVGPSYTNIAMTGTYVTLVVGEMYDLAEFREYGLQRLRRIHTFTEENGGFEEYNSPHLPWGPMEWTDGRCCCTSVRRPPLAMYTCGS